MQRMAHVEEFVRRMGLAAILAMDDGVGRIREKLKDMGVHDNTLIFFMSDNGEPLREGAYVRHGSESRPAEPGIRRLSPVVSQGLQLARHFAAHPCPGFAIRAILGCGIDS
jgi:hypothetical protein